MIAATFNPIKGSGLNIRYNFPDPSETGIGFRFSIKANYTAFKSTPVF